MRFSLCKSNALLIFFKPQKLPNVKLHNWIISFRNVYTIIIVLGLGLLNKESYTMTYKLQLPSNIMLGLNHYLIQCVTQSLTYSILHNFNQSFSQPCDKETD